MKKLTSIRALRSRRHCRIVILIHEVEDSNSNSNLLDRDYDSWVRNLGLQLRVGIESFVLNGG